MATTTLERITVSAKIEARLKNAIGADNVLAEVDEIGFAFTPETALATGTAANQADRAMYAGDQVLSSGNNLDLNLYTGANFQGLATGLDLLGNTLTNAEVVALLIHNRASSAGNLVIGGEGTANAWLGPLPANTDTITLPPGGSIMLFAPTNPAWAVGSSSNNLLRLNASGGDATWRAVVLARSA